MPPTPMPTISWLEMLLLRSTSGAGTAKNPGTTIQVEEIAPGSDADQTSDHPGLLLQTSPYSTPDHLQDLGRLAPQHRFLAQALTKLRPLRADYATASYEASFNWDEIVSEYTSLASRSHTTLPAEVTFDVIVFRSRLKSGSDRPLLAELDMLAHGEAVSSGGLLKYWFGEPDENRRNLATCEYLLPSLDSTPSVVVSQRTEIVMKNKAYGEAVKTPDEVVPGPATLPPCTRPEARTASGMWIGPILLSIPGAQSGGLLHLGDKATQNILRGLWKRHFLP